MAAGLEGKLPGTLSAIPWNVIYAKRNHGDLKDIEEPDWRVHTQKEKEELFCFSMGCQNWNPVVSAPPPPFFLFHLAL